MQNSATLLLSLFGFAPNAALQTHAGSYSTNGPSFPSIRLPNLEMKKIELEKQDPSLPDWVVMTGDLGLKFWRAACCPARH
jgi:hypothetical protein